MLKYALSASLVCLFAAVAGASLVSGSMAHAADNQGLETWGAETPKGIVGAWRLETVGTPEAHHYMTFQRDGTVLVFQAEAGFPINSESPGVGLWKSVEPGKGKISGFFEQYMYARDTHEYLGYQRTDIALQLAADGKHFLGTAVSRIYDPQGNLVKEATAQGTGSRMTF